MESERRWKGMQITKKVFEGAGIGDLFVGKGFKWVVQGNVSNGGLRCINPHSGDTEEIFFKQGRIVDAEDWPIEEFESGGEYYPDRE